MQTIKQPTANQQPGITLLPQKQKAVNKTVSPINTDTKATNPTQFNGLQPTTDAKVQNTGMTMTSLPQTTGLLGITQPAKPASPEFNYTPAEYKNVAGNAATPTANTPQTEFTANQYQSNGYTGVQGETNQTYDPRSESLVQNQITGLLDPNNPLMRKAIAQAQGYSASRGLQSSSIGNEVALSSMIDKALPIAQQDAQTYGQADQMGWQNSFTAGQSNLSREHDASMFDKQGQLNTNLQNQQLEFQNNQNNADRQNQSYQLERNAQLTEKRDQLLQQFQSTSMNKEFLNQLEMKNVEFQQQDSMFEKQLNAQSALDYRNNTLNAYNNYMEQVSAVYSNPNMTPEQQAAGVAKLGQMFEAQRVQLQTIYGIIGQQQPTGPNNSGVTVPPNQTINNPANPNTGPLPVNPTPPNMGVVNPGGGGRGGSGSIEQPQVMR